MRRFIFAVFFVSIFPFGTAADGGQVDRNYVNQLSARKAEIDREYFTRSETEHSLDEVIAFLRGLDEDHSGTHSQLLVRLKDDPTINKYVSRLIESEGRDRGAMSALNGSRSPWIIPLMIELLDADDITHRPHGHRYWGLAGQATMTVRNLLVRSEEFPGAVREWAGGLRFISQEDMRELRDTLRIWWKENEHHFNAEDYHLVQPVFLDSMGADEESKSSSDQESEPEKDEPSREAALGREAQEIADERREVIAEQQDSSIEERTAPAWLWLAGMIALLGGAFVARRFCSKRRRE